MSQAALDVAAGIGALLRADSGSGGVSALASAGIYQIEAPQGLTGNYVIFSQHTSTTQYTLKVLANDDMLWLIKAITIGGGASAAIDIGRQIMARVDVVLTNQTISMSAGKRLLSIRRENDVMPYKDDSWPTGQVFYHIPAIYRVQVTNA